MQSLTIVELYEIRRGQLRADYNRAQTAQERAQNEAERARTKRNRHTLYAAGCLALVAGLSLFASQKNDTVPTVEAAGSLGAIGSGVSALYQRDKRRAARAAEGEAATAMLKFVAMEMLNAQAAQQQSAAWASNHLHSLIPLWEHPDLLRYAHPALEPVQPEDEPC